MKIVDQVPEYIRSLIPYEPGKPIEEVEREYGISDSVKLASNENPLGPSPKALAAIRDKMAQLHLYPDGDCFYLKQGLAKKLGVAPESLIFGNGSNEIIELAVRTFMRAGDEAVMARQAFVVYNLVVQATGGKAKAVALRDYTHDLAAIGAAITPKTKLVLLANPNNPTGTIYRREEWERFLDKISRDVLLLVDEAYFEYVEDAELPELARISRGGPGDFNVAHLFEIVRVGGLAHRLRRWREGIDRHDAAGAPAVQRERASAVGGFGGAR